MTGGEDDAISSLFLAWHLHQSRCENKMAQTPRRCCGVHHHNPYLARPRTGLLWWQIRSQQRRSFPASNLHWNISSMGEGTESVCSLHRTRHTCNQWILAERKKGERRSNMTFQRFQESPSRRQGDLLLWILLREVRHSGGSGILKVYMNPESLPKPARMSVKWEAEWRQDSPSFHLCSKSHEAVSAGPYATGCLSPLEEGVWRQIYIWAAYEMN